MARLTRCPASYTCTMLQGMNASQRLAAAGLGVLALVVLGWYGTAALQRPAPIVVSRGSGPPPVAEPDSRKAEQAKPQSDVSVATQPTSITVHVAGAVKSPGLYTFQPGARVNDALKQAGGPLDGADLEAVNLAAKLTDGTQLLILKKGQAPGNASAQTYSGAAATGDMTYASAPAAASRSTSSRNLPAPGSISLNTASGAELDRLPGVGPSTAAKILAYRRENGGFTSIDELLAVKGIGPKKLQAMRRYLRL